MRPHKIYGNIDPETTKQFYDALEQPSVVKGALMPDAHLGYALPIGAVVATENTVYPSWVGYDIGCGVSALKMDLMEWEIRDRGQDLYEDLVKHLKLGSQSHKKPVYFWGESKLSDLGKEVYKRRGGAHQIGTLGGGNHFIELGFSEIGETWIIVHSGSRGFGHGLATEYMKIASQSDKPKEGHYGFSSTSELGLQYLNDTRVAQAYALYNRDQIMTHALNTMENTLGKDIREDDDTKINRNHNHVVQEDNLWVHRKGATHAEEGMLGVIPGNMRDGSFIVRGRGNKDSLCSSSHGAGRLFSRSQAKKLLSTNEFTEGMGSIVSGACERLLDEAPLAYKNIHDVMGDQKDLVEVVNHVRPLINIKSIGR